MTVKFRILPRLISLIILALLIYLSVKLLVEVNRLQDSLEQMNYSSQQESLGSNNAHLENLKIDSKDFQLLSWDSEISYTLASANLYSIRYTDNKGLQQALLSEAQNLLNKAQHFSPLNINAAISNLSILIDQGAPLNYLLPKIDKLIDLVPKDQDLKADIAKLCFKLSVINNDAMSQAEIIDRLNKLFIFSMDYRGMTQVNRYARLFNQNELLARVKTNVRN